MKLNKNADSIVWIMIGVVILSFAMFGIVGILNYNRDVSLNYSNQVDSIILEANANNIVKKLNLDSINSFETFYIYKNENSKEYTLFTWAVNENYKFINRLWNNVVDLNNFIWDVYVREFTKISNVWEGQNWEDTIKYDTIETIIEKYNKS